MILDQNSLKVDPMSISIIGIPIQRMMVGVISLMNLNSRRGLNEIKKQGLYRPCFFV
ncbi:MAG: hypothetical protein CMB93_00295 [Flammeovirgaceae bacterium]|nr:hypothetical protein [Flammeovirgaceae bacterium]